MAQPAVLVLCRTPIAQFPHVPERSTICLLSRHWLVSFVVWVTCFRCLDEYEYEYVRASTIHLDTMWYRAELEKSWFFGKSSKIDWNRENPRFDKSRFYIYIENWIAQVSSNAAILTPFYTSCLEGLYGQYWNKMFFRDDNYVILEEHKKAYATDRMVAQQTRKDYGWNQQINSSRSVKKSSSFWQNWPH